MLDILRALENVTGGRMSRADRASQIRSTDAATRLTAEILEEVGKGPERLLISIRDALDEVARGLDRVSLAVTGLSWVGSGVPSVEQEMTVLVRSARREVTLCAYAITSGALPLLSDLREVARQGVMVTLVVNEFSRQPGDVQVFLREVAGSVGHRWRLLTFEPRDTRTELHAKVLVVDRDAALVGSANLTFHGMVSNHEMALVVRGPIATLIADRVDALLGETRPVGFV